MKRVFKGSNVLKPVLIIAMLFLQHFSLTGNRVNLPTVATHLLMALKFITKYMVRAGLSFYCMVLLWTIEMNWGQLIPELSKTRKVIAIELQGHGHTPFSDRKLSTLLPWQVMWKE
jgi:hypothetical protein